MAERPAYPNHVGTIGGAIRMGHGLWVHCDNRECLHRARVDLEAIAERYGVELSVAEFVNRSVCSECGARWPHISISLEPISTRGAKIGYSAVNAAGAEAIKRVLPEAGETDRGEALTLSTDYEPALK